MTDWSHEYADLREGVVPDVSSRTSLRDVKAVPAEITARDGVLEGFFAGTGLKVGIAEAPGGNELILFRKDGRSLRVGKGRVVMDVNLDVRPS